MWDWVRIVGWSVVSALKSQRELALANVALRHQLMKLQRQSGRPRLKDRDRLFVLYVFLVMSHRLSPSASHHSDEVVATRRGRSMGRRPLRRNDAPRTFEMPAELAETLAREPEASEFFDSLSFTHRKELVNAIREAKQEDTKQHRLDKAMPLLRNPQKPS